MKKMICILVALTSFNSFAEEVLCISVKHGWASDCENDERTEMEKFLEGEEADLSPTCKKRMVLMKALECELPEED